MELLAAEKHQVEALKNMQHRNKSLSMLDEILEDVRRAADRLELEIEEHAFDDNKAVSGRGAPCRGVRLRWLARVCWHRLEAQAGGQHCAQKGLGWPRGRALVPLLGPASGHHCTPAPLPLVARLPPA